MVNEDKPVSLESITGDQIVRFGEEYLEYQDAFQELVIFDGLSKFVEDVAEMVTDARSNILLNSDTSGLKNLYESLLSFERKYPFIKKDLSKKALELSEIKNYLVDRTK